MRERPTHGFDWYSPSGHFSGWSSGDVPEDMAARGWHSEDLSAAIRPGQIWREGDYDFEVVRVLKDRVVCRPMHFDRTFTKRLSAFRKCELRQASNVVGNPDV